MNSDDSASHDSEEELDALDLDKNEESHISNDESSGTGSKIAFHLENMGMLAHFNLCPKVCLLHNTF